MKQQPFVSTVAGFIFQLNVLLSPNQHCLSTECMYKSLMLIQLLIPVPAIFWFVNYLVQMVACCVIAAVAVLLHIYCCCCCCQIIIAATCNQPPTHFMPLYRSTCSSLHLQLRTGGFSCAKFYCPHALADGSQCVRIR